MPPRPKKKVYIVAVTELNNKRMANADLLKGGVIVVLLLAVLAGFDSYNSYSFSKITGASVAADSGSSSSATDQTAKEPSYTGANWVCFDLTKGELVPKGRCETHNSLYESAALGCKDKCSPTNSVTINCGVGSFVVWEACSESNTKADRTWGVLGEGKTKTYAVGGKDYEVTLDFVGSTASSKFTINGEQSRLLRTGDQWLVDGAWFTLASASTENSAGGTRSADFILMRIKATDQTAKCPATITVSSNKLTAYSQGETAVFTITMRDSAGNIVKRGASLGISSATETPSLMFGKAFQATDSGIITVEVPLTASIYPAGAYAVQVSSEAGGCNYVSGGQSLAVQAATGQTAKVTGVAIHNGWNMVAVPTFFPGLISTTCRKDDGSASTGLYDVVQIWNYSSTTTPDYEKFWLPDNLNSLTRIVDQAVSGGRPRSTSAGWVYNYGPYCSITAAIAEPAVPETFKGWAQVAVQPSWEGKALSDLIQPNCDFGGGWFYDNQPSGVKWDEINLNTKFEQRHVGKGFWAYSSKQCTIG